MVHSTHIKMYLHNIIYNYDTTQCTKYTFMEQHIFIPRGRDNYINQNVQYDKLRHSKQEDIHMDEWGEEIVSKTFLLKMT